MALIGRDDELARVREVLRHGRRCLLVGTGGIGKSAVARHLADEARAAGEPVTWIDVEPLDSVDAIAEAAARSLGFAVLPDESAAETAEAALASAGGLIVLDGVEHLADELGPLLQRWATPGAALLVSSRVSLVGVVPVVRLAPLTLVDDDPMSGAAGRMLLSRVADHAGVDSDLGDLADAVRATGGLPLAVELVAAQIARFGASFFATQRGSVVDDEVIDRSVDRTLSRLDASARSVFASLGWTSGVARVEMISGLAGLDQASVVGALGALVDHGLVFVDGSGFDLLPPIRDRAARLVAQQRPLWAVLEWAAIAVVGDGRDEPTSYTLFDGHIGTFMHLAWQAVPAIEDQVSRASDPSRLCVATARLLNAMYTPLSARMHVRELIEIYTRYFAALDSAGLTLPPDLEGHTARYAAMATSEGSTIRAAELWLDRAESVAGQTDRPELLLGRVWSIRSVLCIDAGDLVRAERLARQSIEAATVSGERFFVEQSRRHLAEVALQRGELDEAERLIDELLSWSRTGSVHHTFVATTFVGWIAVERGERAKVAAVARSLQEGLGGHEDYDSQVRVEADLMWLATDPSRLAATPEWNGDATWWLRLEQRVRRAGALPIAAHWEHVLHTAADVLVLADTVPMMQPRLAAGLLLGDAALAGEDHLQARMAYGQVLRDGIRWGYRLRVADALDGISVLAVRGGHDVLAGEVAGAAAHVRSMCGAQPWVRPSLPERYETVRPVPARWLVNDDLAATAADDILHRLRSHATVTIDSTLTSAERQVARLVSHGMSNAEIAAHLYVSRRTVESHLARIFRKLGVKNRTQLARLPLEESPN